MISHRPKMPLGYWLDVLMLGVSVFMAGQMFAALCDQDVLLAAFLGASTLLGFWQSRRVPDYWLCAFCSWYLQRKMQRMFERHNVKFQDKDR